MCEVLALVWLLLGLGRTASDAGPAGSADAGKLGRTARAREESAAALALLARGGGEAAAIEDAARVVTVQLAPAELERRLAGEPDRQRAVLAGLGDAYCGAGTALRAQLGSYLSLWARQRAARVARRGAWSDTEVEALLAFDALDPARFAAETAFRGCVLGLLPHDLDPTAPRRLRDDLLLALNRAPVVDAAAAETVASAWGALPRRSTERKIDYGREPLRFDGDAEGEIRASVFSFPSSVLEEAPVAELLRAVRALAPRRQLLALTDLPLRSRLARQARALRVELLPTYGRTFSPWPRDPFSLVHRAGGGVVVLARPNAQAGREEDLHMGAWLVAGLPVALDRAWGEVRWAQAPVPFHNGQLLLTREAAWTSLHALEPRILALLGAARVPVESFATRAGIASYVDAARRAGGELGRLVGRPVRFVHPLPEAEGGAGSATGAADPRSAELMRRIGGGAGYDLDSLLTLLPPATAASGPHAAGTALVASLAAGGSLLARLGPADWSALRRGYDLEPAGRQLSAGLEAAQRTPRAAGLDSFLDLVAEQLATEGWQVRRLPLLVVPANLLRGQAGIAHGEFLLGWNNVVLESPPQGLRGAGFASLLPSGDREARALFAAAGCRLDLLPPLVHSVILNGGYRCASNHLRAGG
ncbi:MAG TPA: hypothetical protein VHR45_04990 [Thermoanaerobaculia bacterium]|nr:hypothetical protein [Thermoanaerobaculia bacterium]